MKIFFEAVFHYVAQAGLKLKILLPLLSGAGIVGVHHHVQLLGRILITWPYLCL
jgi:hypothetical protein